MAQQRLNHPVASGSAPQDTENCCPASWSTPPARLPPSPYQAAWAFLASLTVSCPCPVFSPRHTLIAMAVTCFHMQIAMEFSAPAGAPAPKASPWADSEKRMESFKLLGHFETLESSPLVRWMGKLRPREGGRNCPSHAESSPDWPAPRSPDFQSIASSTPTRLPPHLACLLWAQGSLSLAP